MSGMKMTIRKEVLLEKLHENRAQHSRIFEEAQVGFRAAVIKLLDQRLADARTGKPIKLALGLHEPRNQVKDYDRAIAMVELNTQEEIELEERQFAEYVMDQWPWRQQFLSSNAPYSEQSKQIIISETGKGDIEDECEDY